MGALWANPHPPLDFCDKHGPSLTRLGLDLGIYRGVRIPNCSASARRPRYDLSGMFTHLLVPVRECT